MDQFEALVRLNQLRARKSKDLSLKWIVLSSLTCFLLLFGTFGYWLTSYVNPLMFGFSRDLYGGMGLGGMGLGGMSSMGLGGMGMGGYGSSMLGGGSLGGYGGLSSMDHHGSYGGSMMGSYGRHHMISALGPFSGCYQTRTRFDFFGFQCRMPTESFLRLRTSAYSYLPRNRTSSTLLFCEFLLIVGALVFTFATIGSCCGCVGKNKLIGLLQLASGVIYLLGIILFFSNIGDGITKDFCGVMAEPFHLGYCSVGIGFFIALLADISMFICSLIYIKSLRKQPLKPMPTIEKV